MLRHNNFTAEDDTLTRAEIQAYLDESRPKKNGKPDRTKPHKRTVSDVRGWAKTRGITDDGALEKIGTDLDSYM